MVKASGQLYVSKDTRKILGYDSYGDPIYEHPNEKPKYKLIPNDADSKEIQNISPQKKREEPKHTGWPILWNVNGTVQEFTPSKKIIEVEKFDVYVNSHQHFPSDLPKLNIKNVQEKFLTLDNPYYVACCAAYLSTYLCGISYEHFEDDTSPLISCIARYHLYYHMKRFLRNPDKLKTHMTDKQFEFVQKHIPVEYKWEWKFEQTREVYWLFLKKLKERHIVIKIVSEGAKSLQTQVVFRKIVNDTVIEDDETITIGDMRKAIKDTKVILNTAITPGIILIPGSLIILKKKIAGFNNILTLGQSWMQFGLNKTVNKVVVRAKIPSVKNKSPIKKKENVKSSSNNTSPRHNPVSLPGTSPRPQRPSLRRDGTKTPVKSLEQKGTLTTGTGDNTTELMTLFGASTAAGFIGLKLMAMVI